MTINEKVELISQVGEEIVTSEELKQLLESAEKSGEQLIAYDGFEPSGQIHIAQGILKAINVNKLTKAGIKFKMWVADWHAQANNKMDGDLERIKVVGRYFIEVWKACGMDMDNVEFQWGSELAKNPDYWQLVIKIARTNKIKRFIRTAEIMGRQETDDLTLAQLLYPAMQVADIFMLNAKIAQLGMDQRKVNMLAREIGPQLGYWKPIVISHHMLLGLGKPIESIQESTQTPNKMDAVSRAIQLKMSKSNPDSAIFMTDTEEDINRKMSKAWCPEGVITENPVLEYFKYILFEKFSPITIERPEEFGGPLYFTSYKEFEEAFARKEIHPLDAKQTATRLLNLLLQPVRNHFETNAEAKSLLEQVKSFNVTR